MNDLDLMTAKAEGLAENIADSKRNVKTFLVFLEKRIARVNRQKMAALRKGDARKLQEHIDLQFALEQVYMMAIACLKKGQDDAG